MYETEQVAPNCWKTKVFVSNVFKLEFPDYVQCARDCACERGRAVLVIYRQLYIVLYTYFINNHKYYLVT